MKLSLAMTMWFLQIFILSLSVVLFVLSPTAEALQPKQKGLYAKDIFYFDYDKTECSAAAAGGGSTTLSGKETGDKVFNFFVSQGFSNVQAAAITGNLEQESGGFKITIYGGGGGAYYGLAQWSPGRRAQLEAYAQSKGKTKEDLTMQLEFIMVELQKEPYKSAALDPLKATSNLEEAVYIFVRHYEVAIDSSQPRGVQDYDKRLAFAQQWLDKAGGGGATPTPSPTTPSESPPPSDPCQSPSGGAVGDANMKETKTINSKGEFITMPAKYGCGGRTFKIDSRIAANVAYIADKYNSCVTAGLEDGHNSHGAGLAVDMIPKNGDGKDDWKNSVEAAARDMGWFGDGANDPKGSKPSCANYGAGDYGQCMHVVHPDKFPKWMRWLGYNGAHCHGDPWHIYGGCGAHLHIGWDTPNGDGVSPNVISSPRESVYVFPAPIPDDLRGLIK